MVKECNQEAGNELHEQMHYAQNSKWTREDLSELIKSENDVADKYYKDGDILHSDIRNIQDSIITFYGELQDYLLESLPHCITDYMFLEDLS